MDPKKILDADLLDIVFEGRNKQYGAYDLRKTYNERLKKALIITAFLGILIFLGSYFYSLMGEDNSTKLDVKDLEMSAIKKDAPPPPPPPPPPPTPPPPPEINRIKFTPPTIVKDEEVKPDEKIEDIKEDQAISNETKLTENTQVVNAPVEEKSNIVETPTEDPNKVFNKVEVEASFPGGEGAWGRYVQKNLNGSIAVENGAPEGTYQVIIRFIVSKDGSISDVQAESNQGYGMEEEAVKIIKRGPKWVPALQNGHNVNAYRRQPITFVVSE